MEIRFYRKIADAISDKIIACGDYDEKTASDIRYGMVCTFSDLYKLVLYTVIFSFAGYFNEFVLAFLPILLLRPFIGGLHAKTEIRCLILSFLNIVTVIILATFIPLNIYVKIASLIILSIVGAVISPTSAKSTYRSKVQSVVLASLFTIVLMASAIWLDKGYAGAIIFWSVVMVYFYGILKILKKDRILNNRT